MGRVVPTYFGQFGMQYVCLPRANMNRNLPEPEESLTSPAGHEEPHGKHPIRTQQSFTW